MNLPGAGRHAASQNDQHVDASASRLLQFQEVKHFTGLTLAYNVSPASRGDCNWRSFEPLIAAAVDAALSPPAETGDADFATVGMTGNALSCFLAMLIPRELH